MALSSQRVAAIAIFCRRCEMEAVTVHWTLDKISACSGII